MRTLTTIIAFLSFGTIIAQSTDNSIANIDRIYKTVQNNLFNYDTVIKAIPNQSQQNGELKGYYDKSDLKLLTVIYIGETGKRKTDYYFTNSKPYFVEDIYYTFDRLTYWSEKKSKENNDSIAFNTNKTINEHDKYYFVNGQLICWTSLGAPVDKRLATYKGREKAIPKDAEDFIRKLK